MRLRPRLVASTMVASGLVSRVTLVHTAMRVRLMSGGPLIDGRRPHASHAADAIGAPAYDPGCVTTLFTQSRPGPNAAAAAAEEALTDSSTVGKPILDIALR